jgi:hypothetical protein
MTALWIKKSMRLIHAHLSSRASLNPLLRRYELIVLASNLQNASRHLLPRLFAPLFLSLSERDHLGARIVLEQVHHV